MKKTRLRKSHATVPLMKLFLETFLFTGRVQAVQLGPQLEVSVPVLQSGGGQCLHLRRRLLQGRHMRPHLGQGLARHHLPSIKKMAISVIEILGVPAGNKRTELFQ